MTSGNAQPGDVTQLLNSLSEGDDTAIDKLIRIVYEDLRAVASRQMRMEGAGHTLQPTALVHEAYLRLVGRRDAKWHGKAHFLSVAAQAMRRVLIDHARRRKTARRGGGNQAAFLEQQANNLADPVDLLALDQALDKLATGHHRQARTVELRYFGGLGIKETAGILNVSEVTVKRDWRYAKAWLYREMETGHAP